MAIYTEGDKVKWKWGNNYAYGLVKNIFPEKTTRTINGSEITKYGTKDNPALFIEQQDGTYILMLSNEIYKS